MTAPFTQGPRALVGAEALVPFNRPFLSDREIGNVRKAYARLHLAGDGHFTALCSRWLEREVGSDTALLTPSCTAALEMMPLLLDLGPGDEVIMPSFTFVSTASAFVLRGATPVFVDVRPDTLNIDETLIEAAITPRTKAIVVVHYAGVACEMDTICAIAERHGLVVLEDAAQALMSSYRGRPLGGIGALGAISFHETKNITCGEGGSLQINDPRLQERAQHIREKGTNRKAFLKGEVDRYTWVDIGSSYLLSEIAAALLWGQLEQAETLTRRRLEIWDAYHAAFAPLEAAGLVQRPTVPPGCQGNGHMYYLVVGEGVSRADVLAGLIERKVCAVSHYVPLHSSPAGRRFGRASGELPVTDSASTRLMRLPLFPGLEPDQARVIDAVYAVVRPSTRKARWAPATMAPTPAA